MAATAMSATAPRAETELTDEIAALQSRLKALQQQRTIQASSILSSRTSQAILERLQSQPPKSSHRSAQSQNPLHLTVARTAKLQARHNLECLYHICAGITAFKVVDADPHAADKGNVLGIRIEAFQGGRFMRPYYVFLNKPYKNKTALRVHRHTVPPCIPLAALAKRHLPSPSPADDGLKSAKQSLVRFVRALRGEIAAYHNRLAVLRGMRKAFALDGSGPSDKGKSKDIGVSDVSAADAEMRQIRIEWHDGKIGRIVVSEKGDVLKAVIFGDEGRDRPTERCIQGGDRRVEGVAERLLSM